MWWFPLKAEGALFQPAGLTTCSSAKQGHLRNLHISLAPRKDPCCCSALQLIPKLKNTEETLQRQVFQELRERERQPRGVTGRLWPPGSQFFQGVPQAHDGGAIAPKDSGAPPREGSITPGKGAQGAGAEAGKAGPCPRLGLSLRSIPPTMAKDSQQTSIYSTHVLPYSQQWLSAFLIYLMVCSSSLSIHPSMGPLSVHHTSTCIFSLFFLYNKLQGRGCVNRRQWSAPRHRS